MLKEKSKSDLGKLGEAVAQEYLENLGHTLLVKNYRYKKLGEIDLVTKYKTKIHFIEVKTRKNTWHGFGYEAVNYKKLEKLIRVAEVFRDQHKLQNFDYQFDIVSIDLGESKVEYYENVTM